MMSDAQYSILYVYPYAARQRSDVRPLAGIGQLRYENRGPVRITCLILPICIGAWACTGSIGDGPAPVERPPAPTTPPSPPDRSSEPTDVVDEMLCEDAEPATDSGRARLLTRFEFNNTVRDLLGDDSRPADAFPVEAKVLGFDNNESAHSANPLLVSKYLDVAPDIATRAVARGEALFGCDIVAGPSCVATFLEQFMLRAFRRPFSTHEHQIYMDQYEEMRGRYGNREAISLVIQAILMSPQFLYRVEPAVSNGLDVVPASPWDLASRLSYFLWGSMPDDELLGAASRGALKTDADIEAQVRRMLADPRAEASVLHFHEMWLEMEGIDSLVKDAATFPEYAPEMRALWLESIRAFVSETFFVDGTMEAMFTKPVAYADAQLGALYGWDVEGAELSRVELDPERRAGLLTQPALMALLSNPDQTSPIRRGVFMLERVLCDPPPPPPANIAVVPPDPDPNSSTRERFFQHTENDFCRSCHIQIDPLGFGFEKYDALGRFRAMEAGAPVDATGEIVDVREEAINGPFDGAVELSAVLSNSEQVADCLATQWFRYAVGRVEGPDDVCSLENVKSAFKANGGAFEDLIVAITLSDAFRYKTAGGQ